MTLDDLFREMVGLTDDYFSVKREITRYSSGTVESDWAIYEINAGWTGTYRKAEEALEAMKDLLGRDKRKENEDGTSMS